MEAEVRCASNSFSLSLLISRSRSLSISNSISLSCSLSISCSIDSEAEGGGTRLLSFRGSEIESIETDVFLSLTHSKSPLCSPSYPEIGLRRTLSFFPRRPMKLERLSLLSLGTESFTLTVSSVMAAGAVRPRFESFRRNKPSIESSSGVTGAEDISASPCR